MRGFIDAGENKKCLFISNTLAIFNQNTFPKLWLGSNIQNNGTSDDYRLCRTTSALTSITNNGQGIFKKSQATNGKGNFISTLENTPYQCCSVFAWAVISVLSLIQGQYATDVSQCSWYDPLLIKNYPKGINSNTKDTDNNSVISSTVDGSKGSVFVTQGYGKTTHNGSVTGITNVNGWLWQLVIGSWGDGSRLLKRSASIYDITYDNVNNSRASFWETHDVSRVSNYWGGTKSSFPDLTGPDKDLFGVYAFGGNTSNNSNEFGLDNHYRRSLSQTVVVGGHYDDATVAGVFGRGDGSWTSADYVSGFRAMAYPNPAIGGTGHDTVPPISGGGGSQQCRLMGLIQIKSLN